MASATDFTYKQPSWGNNKNVNILTKEDKNPSIMHNVKSYITVKKSSNTSYVLSDNTNKSQSSKHVCLSCPNAPFQEIVLSFLEL